MTTYYRLGDTIAEASCIKDEYFDRWTRVVVIDPDDEPTLRQIGDLLVGTDRGYDEDSWLDLRDALREFANPAPPKPDEPTGIGAVVRDDEGDLWQLVGRARYGYPWRRIGDTSGAGASKSTHDAYEHIAAVEVIFEGVTA